MLHDDSHVRIDVSAMVRHPGATRPVTMTLERADIDSPQGAWGPGDDALASPLLLEAVLEMLVEGLLVSGSLGFTTSVPCARCLRDVVDDRRVGVSELYVDPHGEEEVEAGYELHVAEGFIDIESLLRDAIIGVLPVRMLCQEDCAGLCSVCGIDLNVDDCGHGGQHEIDPRWAALEKLDLPPG
jgi:uncharacterized protein